MTSYSRISIRLFSIQPFLFTLLIALSLTALACTDAQETGDQASLRSETAPNAEAAVPSIEPFELAARLQSVEAAPVVLDVRTQAEFDAGHIPGAVHIPYDELADRLAEVDTTQGVAVHCMVGPRARKAEATLAAAGVEDIMHLQGGYRAWTRAGLETTK